MAIPQKQIKLKVRVFYLSTFSQTYSFRTISNTIKNQTKMKRILFAVITVICSMTFAYAQESVNPKHIFGVRAGVNFSKTFSGDLFEMDDFTSKFGTGFRVGGIYEIAMSAKRKWYFQTGLNVNYHTTKAGTSSTNMYDISGYDPRNYTIYNNKYKSLYLEIPAMFTRKIRIAKDWGFQPAFGLCYMLGIWGKGNEERIRYERDEVISSVNEEKKLFSNDLLSGEGWSRNAINAKLAIDFNYKNYQLGADIFYGVDLWGIGITVGYNF